MLLKPSLQVLPLPRASSDQIFTAAQTGIQQKKKFCYFARDSCSSFSNLQALLFNVYMSMCAFISSEQYHSALHKTQSSGSCFFCPETQSRCGWCRRAVPRMRNLLCHVISKPLWLLLKPSFPWSFLCDLFIWSLKHQFCYGYFGDVDGCLHVPTTIFPSAVRSHAWILLPWDPGSIHEL